VYYDVNFDHQYQKASEIIRSKVVEVAREFPQVTFAVANEEEFAPELQAVKLDESGADVNVVWYDHNRLKYRMEPVDDFDGSDLRKFVHQVMEDQLKPVWKSQPVPQRQDPNFHILVADNFQDLILKPKEQRDALFYVHAPWCGHCKEFDKVFKKLAKKLGGPRMFFGKMDGTANDMHPGYEIKGYPTIFFVPAFKKHEPVLYDGDRSYKDVKKFINTHSSIFLTEEEREGRNKVEL
jgi:protein disulfide-isomerase A4